MGCDFFIVFTSWSLCFPTSKGSYHGSRTRGRYIRSCTQNSSKESISRGARGSSFLLKQVCYYVSACSCWVRAMVLCSCSRKLDLGNPASSFLMTSNTWQIYPSFSRLTPRWACGFEGWTILHLVWVSILYESYQLLALLDDLLELQDRVGIELGLFGAELADDSLRPSNYTFDGFLLDSMESRSAAQFRQRSCPQPSIKMSSGSVLHL